MPSIGPMELIIVLIIALLVIGPKKLPDAGKSIGKGMREFKDALTPGNNDKDETPVLAASTPAEPRPVA